MNNLSFIIEQLIASEENESIQFFQKLNIDTVLETLVAMANGKGGTVLIGVDDTHQVLGVEDIQDICISISSKVAQMISPRLPYTISAVDYHDKKIVMISVWEGSNKPYLYNMKAFLFMNHSLAAADSQDLLNLFKKRSEHDESWEREKVYDASLEDLDMVLVRTIMEEAIKTHPSLQVDSEEDFLMRMGLLSSYVPTNAAILLFGKYPAQFLPQTRIRISVFSSDDHSSLDAVHIFEDNLFVNIENITKYCVDLYGKTLRIDGLLREETPILPIVAFREALLNACVHRDYGSQRSFLNIVINSDSLQISNYGSLLEGISVESLRTEHHSILRNPDIANICYLCKLIENAGSGTLRIIEECKLYPNLSVEWKDENNILSFVLKGIKHIKIDKDNASPVKISTKSVQMGLNDIVAFIGNNPGCKLIDIKNEIQKSLASTKRYLQLLRESGIIEYVGSPKTGGYKLK